MSPSAQTLHDDLDATELIFMGTGTSGSVPNITCLTAPPDEAPCRTCLATLKPEGKKNIRRNTSAVIRMNSKQGNPRKVTIVIDVGKNFQAAALEYFRQFHLRKLDAVIISHSHADAMNGLDDLRAWTLGRHRIQDYIDVYLTSTTFKEVQRCFPYMVSKAFATGGGDLPEFRWHIIEDKITFEIEGTGIRMTPFLVHHGHMFASVPATATPFSGFATPTTVPPTLENTVASVPESGLRTAAKDALVPYLSMGFKIEHQIVYMSDVSFIPEDVWPIICDPEHPLSVCVLDCLHLREHSSHFALDQSIPIAKKIGAQRTYLTGFSHGVSHEEYVTITEAVGGRSLEEVELTETEQEGLKMIAATEEDSRPIWIRPAHDGLKVILSQKGVVDETYGS